MDENEIYEEQRQPNGFISFLKKVWSAKITGLITMGVTAIVVGLAMGIVANRVRAKYEAEVTYNFPGADNGRYADGTAYNYLNNISYTNLLEAKNSNESFSNIDIDDMSDGSAITVEMAPQAVEGTVEDGKEATYTSPAILKYVVKQKYFKSFAQARLFLNALIDIPSEKAAQIAKSTIYNYALESSKTATSYDTQIDYLTTQYNTIASGYSGILNSYGMALTYNDPTSGVQYVQDRYVEFENYFATHSISTLREVLFNAGFVKDDDIMVLIDAEARIVEIDRILAQNEAEIDALTQKYEDIYKGGSTTGASPFADRIQSLITQNVALQQEKEYLQKKLEYERNKASLTDEQIAQKAAFDNLIDSITAKLEDFTTDYTNVRHDVDVKNIFVTYKDSSQVVGSDSFAWYISAAAAVGAGLILGIIIAYFKGVYNEEKKAGIHEAK